MLAPEPPAGYVRRSSLQQSLEGLPERRLTVLQAPAGFGKTTELADVARRWREHGLVVGWVLVDDDDTPRVFGSYLAAAFEQGGLALSSLRPNDGWSSAPAVHQIGILARAIELHAAPCLLVLDEVDRLPRRTVRFIDRLLTRAPRNLCVAMACRSDPGLDLAIHVLGGGAIVIDTQQLRFSRAEMARFFDGGLSREELSAVEERTAGWPVAVMLYRNVRAGEANGPGVDPAGLTEDYIGVRLLSDLSPEDRASLLDLAVFDWIDTDLVDEVLGSSVARVRVSALPALDGLLVPVDRDHTVRRLHPLVRDACLDLLAVEDPTRKRFLHERIALALVSRGHLAPAWRQASETGDDRLVGELMDRFGLVRLWFREGVRRMISAGRFLTPEITAEYPRLELLRCILLCLAWRFDEAAARFEAVGRRTDRFTRDREGGDADALAVDRAFTQAALAGGIEQLPLSRIDSWLPAVGRAAGGDDRARFVVAARHTLLGVACYRRAEFEASDRHGLQALAHFAEDERFGVIYVNMYRGMSAMAQGQVQAAAECYARAGDCTRRFFPSDPCLVMSIDALTIELALERNRWAAVSRRTLNSLMEARDSWFDVHVATIAIGAELILEQHDVEAVIRFLRKSAESVQATNIESMSHNVSALLAHFLAEAGRVDEAREVWRDHGLPCGATELVDLDRQSWRTMEALSCARIWLLAAQGECDAAEALAQRLCDAAAERGLVRTVLRGLATSMVAAELAGRQDLALVRLGEFLRLTRRVDYVRPLVRHREIARPVLRRLLCTDLDEELRPAAESTLAHLDEPSTLTAPEFSPRELEVLTEVKDGGGNREVAGRLGITAEGVRYHLKNIYRKTRTTRRTDAVRYAQSLGVLS